VTLAQALLDAQIELPVALERNAQGYGYRYTTLDKLLEVVRPVLNKHGLAVEQAICFTALPDGPPAPTLVTRLRHPESGETEGDTMLLPPLDGNMQHHGSAITYARRYALAAMLGIASEEDDDAPVRPQERVPAPESRRVDADTPYSERRLTDPATDAQMSLVRRLAKEAGVEAPESLTKPQASQVIEELKAGTFDPAAWTVPF